MGQINSKTAASIINDATLKQDTLSKDLVFGSSLMGERYSYVTKTTAINAVVTAEIEIKNKAIKCFCDSCERYTTIVCGLKEQECVHLVEFINNINT